MHERDRTTRRVIAVLAAACCAWFAPVVAAPKIEPSPEVQVRAAYHALRDAFVDCASFDLARFDLGTRQRVAANIRVAALHSREMLEGASRKPLATATTRLAALEPAQAQEDGQLFCRAMAPVIVPFLQSVDAGDVMVRNDAAILELWYHGKASGFGLHFTRAGKTWGSALPVELDEAARELGTGAAALRTFDVDEDMEALLRRVFAPDPELRARLEALETRVPAPLSEPPPPPPLSPGPAPPPREATVESIFDNVPPADPARALDREFLERRALRGDVSGQRGWGRTLLFDAATESEGESWLIRAAERNDAASALILGVHALLVRKPPDEKRALTWLARAAELGNAAAMDAVGQFYWSGKAGLERGDCAGAIPWLKRAADRGYRTSMNNLAWLLAVCADPAARDGERAVAIAEEALARAEPGEDVFAVRDTLAAAYCAAGRFGDAIATQAAVIEDLRTARGESTDHDDDPHVARLRLYQEQRCWQGPDPTD